MRQKNAPSPQLQHRNGQAVRDGASTPAHPALDYCLSVAAVRCLRQLTNPPANSTRAHRDDPLADITITFTLGS